MSHKGVIHCAAFSPDSLWLATGSDVGASVWSADTRSPEWLGKRVAVLPHRYPVTGIAFTSDPRDPQAMMLRTLALESKPTGVAESHVEAHRWSFDVKKQNKVTTTELLAGRMLSKNRHALVNLSKHGLAKRWRPAITSPVATASMTAPLRRWLPNGWINNKPSPNQDAGQAAPSVDGKHAVPGTIAPAQIAVGSATEHRNQALFAATAGDWDAAVLHLQSLLEADPAALDSPEVMMFAVDVFDAAKRYEDVLKGTRRVIPLIESESVRNHYIEKRADAYLRLARGSSSNPDRERMLEKAVADLTRLKASWIEKRWLWALREAEIHVMMGELDQALSRLEASKELQRSSSLQHEGKESQSVAQNQRLAAIYLAQAGRSGSVEMSKELRLKWQGIAAEALAQQKDERPEAKGRAAWVAVLGPSDSNGDTARTACEFSENACNSRPASFYLANTCALAYLRAGKLEEAQRKIEESKRLYEAAQPPGSGISPATGKRRGGRPIDWLVQALIFATRAEQTGPLEEKEALVRSARDELNAFVENPLPNSSVPRGESEWRANWNDLDQAVLRMEIERRLAALAGGRK